MRGFASLIVLALIGIAPAVSAQAADNRCAYLETDGTCICAIPSEWVENGVVGHVTGDALVTVPAGFSGVPEDGKIKVGDPSTIVAGANGAQISMGQCFKELPINQTVYVDKKGDSCECAHVMDRVGIPWLPAFAAVTTGAVIIVTTSPGNPATPE